MSSNNGAVGRCIRTWPYALLFATLFCLASVVRAEHEIAADPVQILHPNLNFEGVCYGVPCGWSSLTPFGLVTATSIAHAGNQSAALTLTRGDSALMTSGCLQQLTPGATYTLEYWYNAGDFHFDHLSTFVEWHTPDCYAPLSSSLVDVASPIGDNDWHRVTGSVTVPDQGRGAATIALQAATNGHPATVLIDDITWAPAR
jgi:hypothetical protein